MGNRLAKRVTGYSCALESEGAAPVQAGPLLAKRASLDDIATRLPGGSLDARASPSPLARVPVGVRLPANRVGEPSREEVASPRADPRWPNGPARSGARERVAKAPRGRRPVLRRRSSPRSFRAGGGVSVHPITGSVERKR